MSIVGLNLAGSGIASSSPKHTKQKNVPVPPERFQQLQSIIENLTSSEAEKYFHFVYVLRDVIQSNLDTEPTAEEILACCLYVFGENGANYDAYQVTGGTFFARFVEKARDEWGENEKILSHFKDVITTALFRNDCGLAYERNPQDVLDALVLEFAKRGLKRIENFHHFNDPIMLQGVFKAVKKAQESGYDIQAQKVVYIEDNPNFDIEQCIRDLKAQAQFADEGIYIKNANNKMEPDQMYLLVKRIAKEFPGEKIRVHTHNNNGLGYAIYLAAAEAAAEADVGISFDTAERPLAEGTAQVDTSRLYELLCNHPNDKVAIRAILSPYNPEAAKPDYPAMYALRFKYRDLELRYSIRSAAALFETGMAGGAAAALKSMGVLKLAGQIVKTADEDDAVEYFCKIRTECASLAGYPSNVTPTQKMQDEQAATEMQTRAQRKPEHSILHASMVNFLVGGLGRLPEVVFSGWQRKALEERNLTRPLKNEPADQIPDGMPAARAKLVEMNLCGSDGQPLEIKEPDVVTAALLKNKGGAEHVGKRLRGKLERRKNPAVKIPFYAQAPYGYTFEKGASVHPYAIFLALGGAPELERFGQAVTFVEKHKDGFFKTTLGEDSFYSKGPDYVAPEVIRSSQDSCRSDDSYLQGFHARWAAEAEEEVRLFVEQIPQRLKDAGFDVAQAAGALSLGVPKILADVVDTKAKEASKRSLPAMNWSGYNNVYENAGMTRRPPRNGNGRANGQKPIDTSSIRSGTWFSRLSPKSIRVEGYTPDVS